MSNSKQKTNNQEGDDKKKKIEVRSEKKSSLSDFVKRPIPSEEEVNSFEDSVKEGSRDEEIEQNLSDIYKDKKGQMVDVSKLKIKNKKSFWFKLFRFIFVLSIILAIMYFAYWYFYDANVNSKNIDLRINGPESVMVGEEFNYTVEIFNVSDAEILDMELDINYADNFIFIDSSKPTKNGNNSWSLGDLKAKERVQIKITGMIVGRSATPNISQAILTYMPGNFSSQFQEKTDINTILESHGFNTDFDYLNTALVGETHEISILFAQEEENYINSFDLKIESPENIEILLPKEDESDKESNLKIVSQERNTFRIAGFDKNYSAQELKFRYRVKEKINDKEDLNFVFLQNINNQEYVFLRKNIDLQIMKSDLNLSLIINSSKNGEPINFGENLNYTLSYQNKGEIVMENVTIMLVVDNALVDWQNIEDENNGIKGANTIAWSKEQIPDLAEIKPEEKGNINLILPVKEFQEKYIGQDLEITSYAQFSMKDNEEFDDSEDNRSNEIINQINSDLSLEETILYFNDKNIPVGSGPLPPQVGETSTFRLYWEINNNLHDLEDLMVELELPEHVEYEGVKNVNVGKINYKSEDRKIVWDIGELSTNNHKIKTELEISIEPKEEDEDKILIISPGAKVSATDTVTGDALTIKSEATTTKLEEDDIANLSSDGRIVP